MLIRCTECVVKKLPEEFPVDKKKKNGRGSWCKKCVNAHKRQEYAENRDKHLNDAKQKRLANGDEIRAQEKAWRDNNKDFTKGVSLRKYWPGSTWQEALANFQLRVAHQNNLCKICNLPETCVSKAGSSKTIRDLCVDHCHEVGRVRGLLCDACNRLIALAKDKPEVCSSAAIYLRISKL